MTPINFLKGQIDKYQSDSIQSDTAYITMLILTHQCNLNCDYCYEKYKDSQSMNFDTAKQILNIEYERAVDQGYSFFIVSLFGGEPNLKFGLIKQIECYLSSLNYRVPYTILITTNGVNFTEDEKDWYTSHRATVELCLSIDGDRITQNMHRGHFDDIDINFFATNYPNQYFTMVLMPDTLKYLNDNINFLSQFDVPINCNLASGYVFDDKDSINLFVANLKKLSTLYLSETSRKSISFFNVLQLANLVSPRKCYYTCGFHTYDCDGRQYSCTDNLPFILGDLVLDNPLSIEHESIPTKCQHCQLRHGCMGCRALNTIITRDKTKIDCSNCTIKKALYHELALFAVASEKKNLLNKYDEGTHRKILEGALLVLESEKTE